MSLAAETPGLSSALLSDACDRAAILPWTIRPPAGLSNPAIGYAYTFAFDPGDNLAFHIAVAKAPESRLLVGVCGTPAESGVFGAILGTAAVRAGLAGLVTDAQVRDIEELRALGFPVFATGSCPRKAEKSDPGKHDIPVRLGEVGVSPKDLVCADEDGIVIVPRDEIETALSRANKLLLEEERLKKRVAGGESTLDALGLEFDQTDLGFGQ